MINLQKKKIRTKADELNLISFYGLSIANINPLKIPDLVNVWYCKTPSEIEEYQLLAAVKLYEPYEKSTYMTTIADNYYTIAMDITFKVPEHNNTEYQCILVAMRKEYFTTIYKGKYSKLPKTVKSKIVKNSGLPFGAIHSSTKWSINEAYHPKLLALYADLLRRDFDSLNSQQQRIAATVESWKAELEDRLSSPGSTVYLDKNAELYQSIEPVVINDKIYTTGDYILNEYDPVTSALYADEYFQEFLNQKTILY